MKATDLSVGEGRLSRTVFFVQFLLAIAFIVLGGMQLLMGMDRLIALLVWPAEVPESLVRFVGGAEVAGALGLVLPLYTPLPDYLMRWAAFGLATAMVCAIGFHLMLFQGLMVIPSLALGAMALYVGVRRM